ncbi:MAG: arylamine N-acetyltransferase family protein [Terriglobales bacterium]
MDTTAYLARIGVSTPLPPDPQTLSKLHLAHLTAVPFENLDIHLGRKIVLDEESFFTKVVHQRRGGFCYELNGLFAALLRHLGFRVTLLSARVTRVEGGFGPEYDHLTLLVEFPGSQPRRLADVGFGDSFREPLLFDESGVQPAAPHDNASAYRLDRAGDGVTLLRREEDGVWKPQYAFSETPRRLDEFAAMCHFQQTSPDSHFTQRRICSRATDNGRITLADLRLIVTENGLRTETMLEESEYRAALLREFGIDLEA